MTALRRLPSPVVMLLALAVSAAAQNNGAPDAPTPRVTAELTPESTVVGQPVVLRIEVLVPTWLPEPPDFPSLDLPNVIVRLPERATGPVSERVDGETWSGVARSYRLYPMRPGELTLPAQWMVVTYADPETTQPVQAEVLLEPFRFTATMPEAAAGLEPPILAAAFTMEQSIDGAEGPLGPGDAVVRKVTARIGGTTPLFIPELIPALPDGAVQAHAAEPRVAESEDRGVLSGSREETVTYVARYGGTVDLPAITVAWFDVGSGRVETAQVDGVTLTVDAPPPPREARLSGRQVAMAGMALALAGGAIWLLWRYLLPPLRRQAAAWQERRLAGEAHAAAEVRRAIGARDLNALLTALDIWARRCPEPANGTGDGFEAPLLALSRDAYGPAGPDEGAADAWRDFGSAFDSERTRRRAAGRNVGPDGALPPLNPT